MKKTPIIALLALLLLSSCVKNAVIDIFKSEGNELMVSVDIPEPEKMKTRAATIDNLIQSIYVLVFDKNGLFLSRHKGELVAASNYANYRFNNIPLTEERDSRILHFVANGTWTNFSDAATIGKHEAEIIPSITVTEGVISYWQRVVVENGLPGTTGQSINLSETILLLRNVVKLSVNNRTNDPTSKKYLTDVTFAVGNYIDKGTVAPYSTSTQQFDVGAITEANGAPISIQNENEFDTDPKYIYERKNSVATQQTYLIVKGYFQTDGAVEINAAIPSYYKIDLVDQDASVLLDLQRNYHYIVTINDAAEAGYPTMEDAMLNAASNNINASVTVSEYTAISDGEDILRIEKSVFSFVRAGEPFSISYSYVDGVSGETNNTDIGITLDQDASQPVVDVNGISFTTDEPSVITGRTAGFVPKTDIYQAMVTIRKKSLTRKVTLRLRSPINFLELTATPNIVATEVGQVVKLSFKFPADISPSVFPMPIYITTKRLSPDPSGGQILSIDPSPSGDFRYLYMAHYLGFDIDGTTPKTHYVSMVSNSPSTNEEVKLSADIFNDATVQITSSDMLALTDMSFTPNPVMRIAGTPVDLNFTIPARKLRPYEILIYTNRLEYVSQLTGTSCEWNDELKCYVYTTSTDGKQTIKFKTREEISDEIVRIDGFSLTSIWTNLTTETSGK